MTTHQRPPQLPQLELDYIVTLHTSTGVFSAILRAESPDAAIKSAERKLRENKPKLRDVLGTARLYFEKAAFA
jgi:hypothetical protein